MRHVVSFSGGVGSWAAAKRVAAAHGTADLVLLFCDTMMEDEDLYRFIDEAAANVGGTLVRVADGRTPWDVFFDERYLGNNRVDPCSKILKRELADAWLRDNCDPAETTCYVGIDWTEIHRFEGDPVALDLTGGGAGVPRPGLRRRMAAKGWTFRAPLCEPPLVAKPDVFALLAREGIARPRLYDFGFSHNNCGGFCVKAGQAHFALLLRTMPARYAWHEAQEQRIRAYLQKDVAILRDRTGGKVRAMTLREFRERIEHGMTYDLFEVGGCGCFVDDPADDDVREGA